MIRIIHPEPIIATIVWLVLIAAATVSTVRIRRSPMVRQVWDLARVFLTYGGRGKLLLAQAVVAVTALVAVILLSPIDVRSAPRYAGFFQTAAQVQAGILVAFALTQYGDDTAARAVRPCVGVAVLFGSVGLFCGVAGTAPLSTALLGWALALTVGGGTASLLSLVLISWRLLR